MSEKLKDFDNFFYYGQGNLKDEIESDLLQIVQQSPRSLLYSRSRNSAGITENYPSTIGLKVLLPYDIVSALAQRNLTTGDGQDGSRERRVAVSQNQIKVETNKSLIDVSVFYIPFYDIKQRESIGFQLGNRGRG